MIFKWCFRALDGHFFQYSYIKGTPAPCVHVGASPFVTLRLISLPCHFFYCFCDLRRGFFGIAIVAHSSVLDITFLPLLSTLMVY